MMPAIAQLESDWTTMMKAIARISLAGLVPLRIQAEGCSIGFLQIAIAEFRILRIVYEPQQEVIVLSPIGH